MESFYNALHISTGYCPKMSISATFVKEMSRQKKPQGSSRKEPPCGFHFIYALLTALYRPVSYLLRYSRYRKVAI